MKSWNDKGNISASLLIPIVLIGIIAITAAAIYFLPDIFKKNSETSQESESDGKFRVKGKVVDIDYEEGFFTIEDQETGELYKIKIDSDEKLSIAGTEDSFSFNNIKVGYVIELVSSNPFVASGGGSSGSGSSSGGGSGSSGGGGGSGSGGGSGGGRSGGSGGGSGDVNEIDEEDIEDIFVFYPYPAISVQIKSIDTANKKLTVETLGTPTDTFEIIVNGDTDINRVNPGLGQLHKANFDELTVGQDVGILSQEDPSYNDTLTALVIVII